MQCFICVMYMMFLCSAHPPDLREEVTKPEQRSLFRDVIESLRIRSQLPEDFNQNDDENNLAQNYERYSHEDQPLQLPSDSGFIPRRNDRVEISSLRYRSPKSLDNNFTVDIETTETPKGEIVVFIDTAKERSTTVKPKKVQKKPTRPLNNKIKNKVNENLEDVNEDDTPEESSPSSLPMSNTMAGQSQIGNREQQIVVKPTVIVNFRGTIMHKDGEVKLGGGRKNEENETLTEPPQNVFNINQEIKLERTFAGVGDRSVPNNNLNNRGEVKLEHKVTTNVEHDMMMCETSSPEKIVDNRQERQIDNVLQIVFSV